VSIHLFICPSVCPAAAGLLLWARQAGDIDCLLLQRQANAGSATLSAYVVAEHRLVSVEVISCVCVGAVWNIVSQEMSFQSTAEVWKSTQLPAQHCIRRQ